MVDDELLIRLRRKYSPSVADRASRLLCRAETISSEVAKKLHRHISKNSAVVRSISSGSYDVKIPYETYEEILETFEALLESLKNSPLEKTKAHALLYLDLTYMEQLSEYLTTYKKVERLVREGNCRDVEEILDCSQLRVPPGFRVIQRLDKGTFKSVYKAEESIGGLVAVKVYNFSPRCQFRKF